MENKIFTIYYNSSITNTAIHKFAITILLSIYNQELILRQGDYAYKVNGGKNGFLYYKKGNRENWILIANWCFYRLYMVVRYRKAKWLRPMYETLFTKMDFVSTIFDDYSIKIVSKDGQILRSRRFRLSPPSALDKVMSEEFGYTKEKIQNLKAELGFD
jgi:hypothetical protein